MFNICRHYILRYACKNDITKTVFFLAVTFMCSYTEINHHNLLHNRLIISSSDLRCSIPPWANCGHHNILEGPAAHVKCLNLASVKACILLSSNFLTFFYLPLLHTNILRLRLSVSINPRCKLIPTKKS